jgi:hypothetical protein
MVGTINVYVLVRVPVVRTYVRTCTYTYHYHGMGHTSGTIYMVVRFHTTLC